MEKRHESENFESFQKFQRTLHTHKALTENTLQRQVLSTGAKRRAKRTIVKHQEK